MRRDRWKAGLTTFELLVLLVLFGAAGLYLFGKELFSWAPPPQCISTGDPCRPRSGPACCQGVSCIEGSPPGTYFCAPG